MVTIVLEALVVAVPAAMVLMTDEAPFAWSVPAALLACLSLPLRRLNPSLAALPCLSALIGGLGWPAAVVAMYGVGRKASPPVTIAWVAVTSAVPAAFVVAREDLPPNAAFLTCTFALFMAGAPAALGALITTRRRLTASLTEASRARAAELEAREEGAKAAERARIAREIHDAVGHHATLIAVESAALAATTDDAKTRETALRLRGLAKESLAEMRAALGLLNTEPIPGYEGIEHLVNRARAAGLTVIHQDHTTDPPPPPTGRAAYRVVQEALTNVTKHAPGARTEVTLTRHDSHLTITITNGPATKPATPHPPGGHGLHGLRERVTLAGGTLTTSTNPDGSFTVEATLPWTPSKVDKNDSTFGGSAQKRANA